MTNAVDTGQPSLTKLAHDAAAVSDPIARLHALHRLVTVANGQLAETVQEARERRRTWAEVGQALGITKQAAAKRFGASDSSSGPAASTDPTVPELTPRAAAAKAAKHWVVTLPGGLRILDIRQRR